MYIKFVAKHAEAKSSTGKLTAAFSGVLLVVQLHFKGAEFHFGFWSESACIVFQEWPFLDFQVGGGGFFLFYFYFFPELGASFSVRMIFMDAIHNYCRWDLILQLLVTTKPSI